MMLYDDAGANARRCDPTQRFGGQRSQRIHLHVSQWTCRARRAICVLLLNQFLWNLSIVNLVGWTSLQHFTDRCNESLQYLNWSCVSKMHKRRKRDSLIYMSAMTANAIYQADIHDLQTTTQTWTVDCGPEGLAISANHNVLTINLSQHFTQNYSQLICQIVRKWKH